MSFDVHTRAPADAVDIDPAGFHLETVPACLAANGDVASRAMRVSGLQAMTIGVEGEAFTWRLDPLGGLEVVPGDDGTGPRADLSGRWFSDLVGDVRSAMAVMMSGEPVMTRGRIGHLVRWDLALRALVDGRAAYEPGMVDLAGADGAPLDLGRSFRVDDDPAEMRHFLGQAGFLHLRGMFDAGDVALIDAETTRWLDRLSPEDPRSWFATADGRQVCVRATNLGLDDVEFPFAQRLAPIAELTGEGHCYGGTDLLRKPVGVTEGISDLPWHRDCDPGMHSYRCCSLTIGVSVTPSGADNGQLGVLAGSHRANLTLFDLDRVDLPRAFLDTDAGDVTVHLSCALHCATPPLRRERRVTYSSLRLPVDTAGLESTFRASRDAAGRETYAPER